MHLDKTKNENPCEFSFVTQCVMCYRRRYLAVQSLRWWSLWLLYPGNKTIQRAVGRESCRSCVGVYDLALELYIIIF